jgi:low temperature requirement protein LtrA
MSDLAVEREHRVSPVELFFDLVFAFAFAQVTTLWIDHASWGGFGRGLLALAVLWWVWASYAWLTNAGDAEAGIVLAALLFATASLFVAALSVPEAFGADRLVFGIAFFAVVAAFVGLYALVIRHDRVALAALGRMAGMEVLGAALILAAAFTPANWRPLLWAAALIIGFFGPALLGVEGWRVYPAYFAERHGLIIIIAIGEALGAIGFGARGTHLDGRVIVAAVLGLLVAASFWLAYFDFASSGVEEQVAQLHGVERTASARDVYTYAHWPMVTGIMLFAFAVRTTLVDVRSVLGTIPAIALCFGSAVYLLAFVAIRWRFSRGLGRGRPITATAFLLLTPVALVVPAVVALALVAAIWFALHAYELIWWREARARRRRSRRADQQVVETHAP